MSYVVLARKYRPQVFEDMVGQEHVGRTLGNAIRQNRVHHAYLFAGARGLGKTTTARIFAKGLVCERGPTATPCNVCEQCTAVNEGRSVDVVEIDGASNNSVENIRGLREQVHYLPQTAPRKIYIIDEVHMLTTSAFNALLKTLEEPPAHVNFIFATTEPQKVIPTILSRVSRLDFRRVAPEEAVAHLKSILAQEERSVADGGLRLIARASGGSVRDALTLLDQVIAFAEDPQNVSEDETRRVLGQAGRDRVAGLVDALLEHDPDSVMERFDELVTAGHDLTALSMQLLGHMRDLTLAKVCSSSDVFRGATEAEIAALRRQANKAEAVALSQMFDRFSRVVDRLPTSRVQRMLLEMGLLDLAHAEPMVPLGDIVERLEAIAGDTGGGGPGPGPGPARPSAPPPAKPDPHPSSKRSAVPAHPPPAHPPPAPTPAPPAADTSPTASRSEHGFGNSELMQGLWNLAKSAVQPPNQRDPDANPDPRASDAGGNACGPCSEPSPGPQAINLELTPAFEAWEELVARIREREEFVSAVLCQVGLISFADGALKVCAKKASFPYIELTSSAGIRSSLEQATRDHLGKPFTLELVDDEPVLDQRPSIVLVHAHRKEKLQRDVENEARSHGMIQSVLNAFNGTLLATKPL